MPKYTSWVAAPRPDLADGTTPEGRAVALEIMVMNGRIRDLILKPEQTHMIQDIIAESSYYGMETFDQALLNLYRAGVVELVDARSGATNQTDFDLQLRQEGLQPI